ncbi:Transcriptional regulatory protein qseB [Candidatus Burkholderia humilis]|nr:Transcriptional regulatory protein qseB [Candidatus Burkholderia humilis]
MRILIAENDSILADGLVRSLRQSGYAVDHVRHGVKADTALMLQTFDLLILGLGLPLMPGLEVLRRLRARNSQMPVLILTAADSVDERVKGLDLGADDYMAKPFALNELEAHVRALTRRGGPTVVKHGSLSFDQVGRIATIGYQVIDLSARELGVLEVLLQRTGRLVSKEQLVNHLCEWGEEVSNNAIEIYVHRLRKKIEPSGAKIITIRGLWGTRWRRRRAARRRTRPPHVDSRMASPASTDNKHNAHAHPDSDALRDARYANPFASPDELEPDSEAHPRSLFGEIFDWMLAPLLLLWPMSIAVTYLIAKSIANEPFDRALEADAYVIARQI